jgi:hypothetical protein
VFLLALLALPTLFGMLVLGGGSIISHILWMLISFYSTLLALLHVALLARWLYIGRPPIPYRELMALVKQALTAPPKKEREDDTSVKMDIEEGTK